MSQDSQPPHPMTAEEYAKIQAVSARIEGLRRGMIGLAAGSLISAFIIYLIVITTPNCAAGVTYCVQDYSSYTGLGWAVVAFLPWFLTAAYLATRVDRHIARLSRGKYEAPRVVE